MKKNQWTDYDTVVISETRPAEGWWYPVVNPRRVRGSEYIPYAPTSGSPEWVRAANRTLAAAARDNFAKRR